MFYIISISCLGPTPITPLFLAQVHDIDFGSGIAHTFYKMIKHQLGFAPTAAAGTGINGKYFHAVLR